MKKKKLSLPVKAERFSTQRGNLEIRTNIAHALVSSSRGAHNINKNALLERSSESDKRKLALTHFQLLSITWSSHS